MLDQLMQLVQQNAQGSVVENENIPNEYNDAVMKEAGTSIFSGLQNIINNGGAEQVTSLLKGNENPAENNIINQLSGGFIDNITQKFGIDKSTAAGIAATLIPQIISSLTDKAKDPNDSSLDLSGILASLQGGSGGNMSNTINSVGGMLGLDKDKDGDVDLGDITKMFS